LLGDGSTFNRVDDEGLFTASTVDHYLSKRYRSEARSKFIEVLAIILLLQTVCHHAYYPFIY